MPERSTGALSVGCKAKRTAMRWVTLIQLPVAFCAGMSENSAPVAGLRLSTRAAHWVSG